MSGYTIEIRGNSNDSDLILGSTSGSITENTAANLAPLTGRVNTLETNVNTLETNVTTSFAKDFVWVSVVIEHDHNNDESTGYPLDSYFSVENNSIRATVLDATSIVITDAIKAHVLAAVPESDFNYTYDIEKQIRYETFNITTPTMLRRLHAAFFEAASIANVVSVIRNTKYTTMNPSTHEGYTTYQSFMESNNSTASYSTFNTAAKSFLEAGFSWVTLVPSNGGYGASSVQSWWDNTSTYTLFVRGAAGTSNVVIKYLDLETNVTTIDDTLIANYLGSKMFGPSSMDFAIKLSNDGKKMMWYRPLTGATKPSSKFGAASFFNDLSNAWKEAEYDFDSIVYKPVENMIVLTVNEISFNPVTPSGETSPGYTRVSYKMAYDLNSDQLIAYLSDFKFKYTTAQWNDLSNQQGIYAALAFYIPGYITQAQFDEYVTLGNTVESNGLKHYQNNLMSDIYYYVSVNYPEVSNSEGIGGFYSRFSMNEVEQQLRTDVNLVETMVGLNDSVFQLDNKLNGGVPMLNSAILVDDPSINLTSLIWADDSSNIRLKAGGEISSVYNDNALGHSLYRQYENKPFFTITKDSTTLAQAYGNKMYVGDIMASKPFGFADTRPSEFPLNSGYAWHGSMYQQRIGKDICDNFIFVLGGGNIMTSSNGVAGYPSYGTDASYNFNHYKFVFSSECVLNADISSSSYITTGPLTHLDLYSIDSNKELLLTRGRNIYIDANEKMELFDPLDNLLKATNYPIYGIMEFDISVNNKSVVVDDVSGFAFSLNDFKIKDTMGNTLGESDVSFNDDLNVMCFGCVLGGSNFNYSGGLHVLGDVADVTRARYDFGLTVVGAINGNYNFVTQELEGKQNMYLNIVADESSKLALLNNKTVLVSWDTAKPNAPKYFSLLPELMGHKISMMNKEMVMQI
tara:strand:- start:77 stop:2812 length:2736 start_codon:yes stop_codon:yes gene_type:complete